MALADGIFQAVKLYRSANIVAGFLGAQVVNTHDRGSGKHQNDYTDSASHHQSSWIRFWVERRKRLLRRSFIYRRMFPAELGGFGVLAQIRSFDGNPAGDFSGSGGS